MMTVSDKLHQCEGIIGEYVSSIAAWATSYNKAYMVTTRLHTHYEEHIHQNMATVWPSNSVFISAVVLNSRLLLSNIDGPHKILILAYGETVNLIECE